MKTIAPFLILFAFCSSTENISLEQKPSKNDILNVDSLFIANPQYISDGFDFPVGKPDAKGYYNAQFFGANNHLGDDWNGVGGGDTDLGDPIYSIANGYISEAKNYKGGWGNVVRIIHAIKSESSTYYLESLYAHCDTTLVEKGTLVSRGDEIASIGNCDGSYLAHLHLELRNELNKDIGGGYSSEYEYHLDPSEFIKLNRP